MITRLPNQKHTLTFLRNHIFLSHISNTSNMLIMHKQLKTNLVTVTANSAASPLNAKDATSSLLQISAHHTVPHPFNLHRVWGSAPKWISIKRYT